MLMAIIWRKLLQELTVLSRTWNTLENVVNLILKPEHISMSVLQTDKEVP